MSKKPQRPATDIRTLPRHIVAGLSIRRFHNRRAQRVVTVKSRLLGCEVRMLAPLGLNGVLQLRRDLSSV
jgi:hypothetical protein